MVSNALLAATEEYLASLPATLFSRAFDISKPAGRKKAAIWLCEQMEGVDQVIYQRESEQRHEV